MNQIKTFSKTQFVERLRDNRVRLGFKTQKHFLHEANKAGLNLTMRRYGAIERGESTASLDEVIGLSQVLQITTDDLLLGDDGWLVFKGLSPRVKAAVKVIANELSQFDSKK